MSAEQAELQLLSMKSERNKIAIQLGLIPDQETQDALERCMENDWVRLIDVTTLPRFSAGIFRIFLVTDMGLARLSVLKGDKQN